jgi:hypothetical protein
VYLFLEACLRVNVVTDSLRIPRMLTYLSLVYANEYDGSIRLLECVFVWCAGAADPSYD